MTKPKFELIQVPKIKRIDGVVRLYETPSGEKYPSVSTVLAHGIDHSYIDAWRARVGAEVADKISKKATTRGTLIHENIENYLQGLPQTFNDFHVEEKAQFSCVTDLLDRIDTVYALETQLYSDKLRVAGTVDCCAKLDGKIRLIDWKTSSRIKSRDDIHSYFMQCSAYAFSIYERTGLVVGDIMIVMLTADDGLITFHEKVRDWLPEFIKVREKYKNMSGV